MISKQKCKRKGGSRFFNTCIFSIRSRKKKVVEEKPERVVRKKKVKLEPLSSNGGLTGRGRKYLFRGGLSALIIFMFTYMGFGVRNINRTPVPTWVFVVLLGAGAGLAFYYFVWRE